MSKFLDERNMLLTVRLVFEEAALRIELLPGPEGAGDDEHALGRCTPDPGRCEPLYQRRGLLVNEVDVGKAAEC